MKWKVYYGDGSIFSDQDGTVWIAPARNVQVIVIESKDHGWMTQAGDDYYVWDCRGSETRWWGVDKFGLYDYLIEPGYKRVLFGRRTSADRFSEIFAIASSDPDFSKKTSFANKERHP